MGFELQDPMTATYIVFQGLSDEWEVAPGPGLGPGLGPPDHRAANGSSQMRRWEPGQCVYTMYPKPNFRGIARAGRFPAN